MHPDAQTNAPDIDYFFLGDGQVSAAIQWSRNPEMSPYGLLLMNPEAFCRKESTLLFHPELGLSRTMLTVIVDGTRYRPGHEDVRVRWLSVDPAEPIVEVTWRAGDVGVTELFGIRKIDKTHTAAPWEPEEEEERWFDSYLIRDVRLRMPEGKPEIRASVEVSFYPNPYILDSFPSRIEGQNRLMAAGMVGECLVGCDAGGDIFERFLTVDCEVERRKDESTPVLFSYFVAIDSLDLDPLFFEPFGKEEEEKEEGESRDFGTRILRQSDIACIGLNAAVSGQGKFDASIWQYGYEWGQDAAMVASAAVHAGEFELAESVLDRILGPLSTMRGEIAESSRIRDGELAELNANGAVLLALRDYVALSGDRYHLEKYWKRIVAVAELPLTDDYLHPSGLIVGRRDLWERLPWMGIETGFDTATNTFCAEGLEAAAELATMMNETGLAKRWKQAAGRIREAMLRHDRLSCIDQGRVIHRRLPDGSVQRTMVNRAGYHDRRYAPYVPTEVNDPIPRPCDPDSTAALPILYGIVDPGSDTARRTLDHLREHLWNTTGIGGYARSPLLSDPDSPGPWAFVTAWMAEAELCVGMTERAQQTTEWLLDMAGAGGSWFEYYGERKSPPFPPVGIIPWAWGQYLLLVVRGWMGITFNTKRLRIAPRLTDFAHVIRVGEYAVEVEVKGHTAATVNGKSTELTNGGVELALPIRKNYRVVFSA